MVEGDPIAHDLQKFVEIIGPVNQVSPPTQTCVWHWSVKAISMPVTLKILNVVGLKLVPTWVKTHRSARPRSLGWFGSKLKSITVVTGFVLSVSIERFDAFQFHGVVSHG